LYPALRGWSHEQAVSWLQDALVAQLSYLTLAVLLTVGGVFMFVKNYGRTGFRSIGIKKPKWVDAVYALAGFPAYYVLLVVTVVIAQLLIPSLNVDQAQDLGLNGRYDTLQLVFIFIALAGLAPIAEEVLFRGFIYSSLKKAMPIWGAVLVTSSLFAAGHLAEGGSAGPLYIGAIDTFILSLVLIYLREKTGRIWAGIGLHSLKNIIAFVSVFIVHVR
jgi:membrane protease YdiL (CAAX protease family)